MITVSGLISAQEKNKVLKYAKFCARDLKLKSNTEILITVSLCGVDYGQINQLRGNKYQIWINKCLSEENWKLTLGHELQHAKQFEEKRLEIKGNLLYFEGVCMNSVPYIKRPFEVEAKKVGRELREVFLKKKLVF